MRPPEHCHLLPNMPERLRKSTLPTRPQPLEGPSTLATKPPNNNKLPGMPGVAAAPNHRDGA
eukprot:2758483-Lingulodinium_polyedra.AAC.1